MDVALAPATLPSLDRLRCDLLVLGCCVEERPLRGIAGLVDWRLNGWLSRLLAGARFSGRFGEQLLFPVGHRVGPRRALLAGLGERALLDEDRLSEGIELLWAAAARIVEGAVAAPLMGVAAGSLPKRRALLLLTGGARRHLGDLARLKRPRLTVLTAPEDLRVLQSTLERRRTLTPRVDPEG